jgi:hypothetical protein
MNCFYNIYYRAASVRPFPNLKRALSYFSLITNYPNLISWHASSRSSPGHTILLSFLTCRSFSSLQEYPIEHNTAGLSALILHADKDLGRIW